MEAIKRDSFVCYKSFIDAWIMLKDEDRLKYYDRLLQYGIYWVDTKTTGFAETLFILVKPNLDSNNKKYLDWYKWWRPKKPNVDVDEEDRRKKNINIPFEDFWNLYNKKVNKPKSEKKRYKLTNDDREKIMATLPKYIKTIKDKQYQKHPMTYLNNKSWNDEVYEAGSSIDYTNLETFNKQFNIDVEPVKARFKNKYGKEWRDEYTKIKQARKQSEFYLQT